jgi:hypothetical protein
MSRDPQLSYPLHVLHLDMRYDFYIIFYVLYSSLFLFLFLILFLIFSLIIRLSCLTKSLYLCRGNVLINISTIILADRVYYRAKKFHSLFFARKKLHSPSFREKNPIVRQAFMRSAARRVISPHGRNIMK